MIVKTDVDVKPLITGGDGIHTFDKEFPHTVPGVFEAGTENIAGIAGLEAGIQLLLERGEEEIVRTQRELSDLFINNLWITFLKNIFYYQKFFKVPIQYTLF